MQKKSLLVITSYPSKGKIHDKYVVGVASYAKNTLLSLCSAIKRRKQKPNITVLAETFSDKISKYKEKDINIKRIWQRNSFLTFPKLFKEIYKNHKKTNTILIELELAMFGDKFSLILLPIFLLALRILKKKIYIVLHQVIKDLEELQGHLNLQKDTFSIDLLNLLLKILYMLIFKLSSKIIVFDQTLKERLEKPSSNPLLLKKEKVIVIPHAVENFKYLPKKAKARSKLNLSKNSYVLLLFGFLAWYKGTDWVIEAYKKLKHDKNLKKRKLSLVLAGGPNPNHIHKPYYKKYINNLKLECKRHNIVLTGFVPEDKIPLYYQASDLALFPYRTLMSASGPLSLSFSFKKPFLISQRMAEIFETEDIKHLLLKHNLNKDIFTFNLNNEFIKQVRTILKNRKLVNKLTLISKLMQKERSWQKIGKYYYNQLFSS